MHAGAHAVLSLPLLVISKIMKRWEIKKSLETTNKELSNDEIVEILLRNRNIHSAKERESFLHPKLEEVTIDSVGINKKELQKTIQRIEKAQTEKEQVIVFGDYDVDGITGTAILWETLYSLGCKVMPYIPNRVDEGYGLSIKGIDHALEKYPEIRLIITVDNGIVAHEAVTYANSLGIHVIITDHHMPEGEEKHPDAFSIVHTTKLCGAGVAWLLSKEISKASLRDHGVAKRSSNNIATSSSTSRNDEMMDSHLELATLGTIADLVPLTGANRAIVAAGLQKLRQTKRVGLLAIFQEAAITADKIGTYEVGYIIGPRLNAAGRIESAMDSLRLLCIKDPIKASILAQTLGQTNRSRQELTKQTVKHAIEQVRLQIANGEGLIAKRKKIIFIGHESYPPGVIGLVAGKLVEEFYRPAIVLSVGEQHAKASVRSIAGVNIIEFLRSVPEMFVNVGGHTMAAGFTVEIGKMQELQEKLEKLAEEIIHDDLLLRSVTIDCELPFSAISLKLYTAIQQLAPFGMGNPEPVFMTRSVTVEDIKLLGREKNHLKLRIRNNELGSKDGIDAIGFGMGKLAEDLQIGDSVDIAYTIDENQWNGKTSLQLKIKDIQLPML